jgi:hypothetical protein
MELQAETRKQVVVDSIEIRMGLNECTGSDQSVALLWQDHCHTARACYTRRAFHVSSRFCVAGNTQLCYRVFTPMEFANDISKTYRDVPYRVNWLRDVDCHRGIRGNFLRDESAPSGFSAYCKMAGA